MLDFTVKMYKNLLLNLQNQGYSFQTFEDFIGQPQERVVVLRHDVDERPENALKMAAAEHEMGIRSTYYFRIVKISNDPSIIRNIVKLGHEIGYHYEDYSACKGDLSAAIKKFAENLMYFRKFYPVKTVCMHGSSMSKFDNRELWKSHTLKEFNLIGEPYLSVDYSKIFYLTDTARCWDGGKYSVRDYVNNTHGLSFNSTYDIIEGINSDGFPEKIILQSHTLWTDSWLEWIWLAFREKVRNRLKVYIIRNARLKKLSYKLIQLYSNK